MLGAIYATLAALTLAMNPAAMLRGVQTGTARQPGVMCGLGAAVEQGVVR